MKELSIEEKAKAYDEVREKIAIRFGSNVAKEIFSQFEMSEDEKMIKFIKQQLFNIKKTITENYELDAKLTKAIEWLEKHGEQKPADKVEPKFKNGQWIVWRDKCYKVNYNGCGYELVDQNGLSTSLEYGTIDENAHLWDITKDVKDGDVLVTKNKNIFIFKSISNCTIYDYCGLYCGLFTEYSATVNGYAAVQLPTDYVPATKEQRNALMKSMADAGYTFDFDKKELKKIEQKPAWSEEDKNRINRLIAYFEDKESFTAEDDIVYANWLKSLKDRVQPQPKQEWSEEDEDIIKFLISHFCVSHCNRSFQFTDNKLITHDELLEKIRNLRPHWKPSNEQMDMLKIAVSTSNSIVLDSLYNDLMKLKE